MKKHFLIIGLVCLIFLSYVVAADKSLNLSVNKSNDGNISDSKGNEHVNELNISKNTSEESKTSNNTTTNNTLILENKNICANATCFCITENETTTLEPEDKNKTLFKYNRSSKNQCILLSEKESINIVGKTDNLTLTDENNTYVLVKKNDVENKEILKHILLIAAITSILISLFAFWTTNIFTKDKLQELPPANQFESVLKKYLFLSILGFPQNKEKNYTLQERPFFIGLRVTLHYFIMVFIVGFLCSFFFFPNELWYFIILYGLILFFTTIFTAIMAGYASPILLGLISGIGTFLVFISWIFSIDNISIGSLIIPFYMPTSSFLGVLTYVFVSLYFAPSIMDYKKDDLKTRMFVARFFAAITLGIAVYVALQPMFPAETGFTDASKTMWGYAFFGFASGFYISPILDFLRKKVMVLLSERGFKEDEQERIIGDIKDNPEKYLLLSDTEIGERSKNTGWDKEKITPMIKKYFKAKIYKEIENNPEKYLLFHDIEISKISENTGWDKEKINKVIKECYQNKIYSNMKDNPEKYLLLSDKERDIEINKISENTGWDKERLKDICEFMKFVGPTTFKKLADEKITTFEDIAAMSNEKIEEIYKTTEINEKKLDGLKERIKNIRKNFKI